MKLAGTLVSTIRLTFACLSAHWANKGSKVLHNELCKRQIKGVGGEWTAAHLQLSEQRNAYSAHVCAVTGELTHLNSIHPSIFMTCTQDNWGLLEPEYPS